MKMTDSKIYQTDDKELKSFECNICGKSFATSTNLKRHIASIHSRERKFECETCAKSFKIQSHLKKITLETKNMNANIVE